MLNNRYEILERVGVGGMAYVFKAFDLKEKRNVALKVLKPELLKDDRFRNRFLNESRAIAMMSHINIVSVYDVHFEGDLQYIVMEFIEGSTFREYMDVTGPMSTGEALGYCKQILLALRHAHQRGVVHRDIKPHNIMLLDDGMVKVTDFGIAFLSKYDTTVVEEEAMGSVHYISPEQAQGENTDARSDIYSFGIMMYEMITGKLPFDGETPVSIAVKQIQELPPLPRTIREDIPVGLEQIILKAIQKNPGDRYQSAEEMLVDLKILDDDRKSVFDYPDLYTPYKTKGKSGKEVSIDAPKSNVTDKDKKKAIKKQNTKKSSAAARRLRTFLNSCLAMIGGAALALVFVVLGYFTMLTVVDTFNEDLVPLENLVGRVASDVTEDPTYSGFFDFSTSKEYDDTFGSGIIISQTPEPGSYAQGTKVKLVVSLGKRQVNVPNVVGLTQAQAQSRIKNEGLVFETIQQESSSVPEGQVIRTEPAAKTEVSAGTSIKIYVSYNSKTTQVYVPNVADMSENNATQTLYNKGLYVSVKPVYDSNVAKGNVISQSIEPDSIVDAGTEITIYVSKGSVSDAIANGTYEGSYDDAGDEWNTTE